MKNIHILPTDKPSRLSIGNNKNFVFGILRTAVESYNNDFTNQHIYITSDEEIKEGDWYIDRLNIVQKSEIVKDNMLLGKNQSIGAMNIKGYDKWSSQYDSKKIILTTDQDLIKDGVQAITDEFLEWFVKNPSCEEVEVESNKCLVKRGQCSCSYQDIDCQCSGYKIVIPKEEPKQETLKEAAERLCLNIDRPIFKQGAKWQQERSYSEEEVLVKLYECLGHFAYEHNIVINGNEIDKWFEQFKKK
jgi:hypothetical protein